MQISRHGSTSLLSQSSVGLKDIEHPRSLLPIRVQARCISSERHVKAWPRTSGPLSPYTLRKYGACGSDLAQHGRDRIDPGELFPNGVPGNGGRDVADGLFECHTHPGAASGHEAG